MNGKRISAVMFFCVIALLPILTFLLPKKEFSENENRQLAEFPTFSTRTLLNKKFMTGFEEYFSDHFVARDTWVTAKADTEYLIGKRENNGVFIANGRLIEDVKRPDKSDLRQNVDAVSSFCTQVGDKPVYLMLVPTASEILSGELPANAPTWDQHDMIRKIYHKLDKTNKNLVYLDAYMPLYNSKNQYIYYRTDHHWTTLGAFDTYYLTGKKMGFQPYSMDVFDIEHASYDFMGSLFSKTLFGHVKPDVIDLYHYNKKDVVKQVDVDTGKEVLEYPSLYFREFLEKKDKYSVFTGQNQPLVTIHTNVDNGKKLLLFKDSYAHAMVPFLALHYQQITMVDLRYFNTAYTEKVDLDDYDQVLILYNAPNFALDASVRKIAAPASESAE